MLLYIILALFIVASVYLLFNQVDKTQKLNPSGDKSVKFRNNTKPLLWVYVPEETGVVNWNSFMGRDRNEKYLAIYRLCLNSIMHHNSNDFHIVLLHKENVTYYLPNFTFPANTGMVNCNALRFSILNEYGGMYMPIHTLCFRPLISLYTENQDHDVTVFGDIESNVAIAKSGETTDIFAQYYERRKLGLRGGSAFDDVPTKLAERANVNILDDTIIGKRDIYGEELTSSSFVSQNHTRMKNQEEMYLIVLKLDSYRRDNFLLRMSEKQILTSDMWVSHLVSIANQVELSGDNLRTTSWWRVPSNTVLYNF
jgi:hypothetical protein